MSSQLSDYNTKKSSNVARNTVFSDLDLRFRRHPNTSDIRPLTDIEAIKNAVKNLLLTNFSEKPFQPRFGGNLNSLLFALNTDIDDDEMKDQIAESIQTFEPRAEVLNITSNLKDVSHEIKVTVTFKVVNTSQVVTTNINLTRLR